MGEHLIISAEAYSFIGGIILAAVLIIAYLQVVRPYNDKDVDQKIEFGAKIYEIGMDVIRKTRIDRVSIVITHNGDGAPYSGIPLYARQGAYMTDDKHSDKKTEFNVPVQLDLETVNMLHEIRISPLKSKVFHTQDIPAKSLLKSLYEREGVKAAMIFYLEKTKYVTYYASFATFESDTIFPDEISASIVGAESFRAQIRKMYGKGAFKRLHALR